MKPADLYLCEDFDPSLKEAAGTIIALFPDVCYRMDQAGLSYKIPEDFYSEHDLRSQENAYFRDQLEWFSEFDVFLNQQLSFFNGNCPQFARLFYNRLKYAIDSLIIQCFTIEKILSSKLNISRVLYITHPQKNSITDSFQAIKISEKSTYFKFLAKTICRQKNIPFEFIEITSCCNTAPEILPRCMIKKWYHNVPGKQLLKNFLNFFRFQKYKRCLKGNQPGNAVLFLQPHHPFLGMTPRDAILKFKKVYYVSSNHHIRDMTMAGEPCIYNLKSATVRTELAIQCEKACKNFFQNLFLMNWINQKCGMDVTTQIIPFIEKFIRNYIPEVYAKAESFSEFYKSKGIQYIIGIGSNDMNSKAAILASRMNGLNVRRVCFEHGCDVFHDGVLDIIDLDNFDYCFVPDPIMENRFKEHVQYDYVTSQCKVYQYPYYLDKIKSVSKSNPKHRHKRTILYFRTKISVYTRYFNNMVYPITWYFMYQKALVDYFCQRSDVSIIYKNVYTNKPWADKTVIPYLNQKNPGHIRISTKPPRDSFKGVDQVILDRPTTAFFESLATGLPVLCLYPNFTEQLIRDNEKNIFKNCLQSFDNFDEAIQKIDTFINSSGHLYHVTLPLTNSDPMEILLSNLGQEYAQSAFRNSSLQNNPLPYLIDKTTIPLKQSKREESW